MKLCPFCAEEIQDAAIKCKHCGEFLDGMSRAQAPASATPQASEKWYFRTVFLVLILGSVGPLGLPLIWWHPRLSRAWKIGISLAIVLITWLSILATMESLKILQDSYSEVMKSLNVL